MQRGLWLIILGKAFSAVVCNLKQININSVHHVRKFYKLHTELHERIHTLQQIYKVNAKQWFLLYCAFLLVIMLYSILLNENIKVFNNFLFVLEKFSDANMIFFLFIYISCLLSDFILHENTVFKIYLYFYYLGVWHHYSKIILKS